MSLLTIAFTLLFYFASATLLIGLAYHIRLYAVTPTPLRIPTTPAPTTASGMVRRMIFEVTLFNSLFKSNKWIWLFGWVMHAALLFVLLRHLRYFTDPVWSWVALIQPIGKYAAFAMVLALLMGIGLTGLGMKYVAHTDIVAVKAFFLGLMYFDWQPMPTDLVLNLHLLMVALLMIIFPFSKLLHAPGVFFSPTRNQIDNPREKRHMPTRDSAATESAS